MPTSDTPTAGHDALKRKLIGQLQALHALKAGSLRMSGPMLAAVRKQRESGALPEVDDLLGRMLDAFGGHREKTAAHERRLHERLAQLGAAPSRPREAALTVAAVARARLGALGGQNHGANARDAFIFEQLEIAYWELLEQLAKRAGDRETAELARECRADDDEMAGLIRRNFDNVLSLMLASEGLPTLRGTEQPGAGSEGEAGGAGGRG